MGAPLWGRTGREPWQMVRSNEPGRLKPWGKSLRHGTADKAPYQPWLFGMRPANDGTCSPPVEHPAIQRGQKPARTKLDITGVLCLLAARLRWADAVCTKGLDRFYKNKTTTHEENQSSQTAANYAFVQLVNNVPEVTLCRMSQGTT